MERMMTRAMREKRAGPLEAFGISVPPTGLIRDPKPSDKKEPEPDEKDEKKEVKKESEEKKEEEKKKEEKVEKSLNDSGFTYQVVQPVRPSIIQKSFSNKPTGYQILKAMEDGWGKKTTDANTAYEETIARLVKGEFGTGAPGESDI